MSRIEKVCAGVWVVGGSGYSEGGDCLVYALDLGVPVLVDCGCGPGWPAIQRNVRSTGMDPEKLHTLVITHAHIDHMGAAAAVKAETGCRVVAHELDAEVIETGDPVRSAATWYGIDPDRVAVDYRMRGTNDALEFAGAALRLLHTPGHTPGSMVAYLDTKEDGRVLFGQDIHGPFDPSFGSDVVAWRESMGLVIALEADILCEGHFGIYRGKRAVRSFIEGHLRGQKQR